MRTSSKPEKSLPRGANPRDDRCSRATGTDRSVSAGRLGCSRVDRHLATLNQAFSPAVGCHWAPGRQEGQHFGATRGRSCGTAPKGKGAVGVWGLQATREAASGEERKPHYAWKSAQCQDASCTTPAFGWCVTGKGATLALQGGAPP